MTDAPRLLIADDDIELCEMLVEYLEAEGLAIEAVHDGLTALERAREGDFDLLVLDVMMPGLGGFDVLRELRRDSIVPVLMLTARGDDVDSVVGLELGADDYVSKPCNPRVLVARIRAVLRRAGQDVGAESGRRSAADRLRVGDLEMHCAARRLSCRGQPVNLTSTEFSVLEVLLRSAGEVVGKEMLSQRALGRPLARYDRGLDMHISKLRRKLGPAADGAERIETVRGVGYLYRRL